MELSYLLMQKILSMVLTALAGYAVVKTGLLKPEDKTPLNVLSLYAIAPCVMITAYQIDLTPDRVAGLFITITGAIAVHAVFLPAAALLRRPLRLSNTERSAMIYSNAGNLIVPLVSSVLGPDYVFYACSYMVVQQMLMWTHNVLLLGGGREGVSLKKVLLNPNIIAIAIGLVLFLLRIRLPFIVMDALTGVGSMIGPMAMIITGMIIAEMDLKEIFLTPRAYLICFLRLIALPMIMILLFRLTGITLTNQLAHTTLMITILAASGPVASNVVMLSLLFGQDSKKASIVNIMSLMFCIVTMPLMTFVYELIC